jgi:hypothetical protein
MDVRLRELRALQLIQKQMMVKLMMVCEECNVLAKVCMIGIQAPLYVCPSCGKAIEEALECPECEEGSLLEQKDGALLCTLCAHVEEGVCKGGSCSL